MDYYENNGFNPQSCSEPEQPPVVPMTPQQPIQPQPSVQPQQAPIYPNFQQPAPQAPQPQYPNYPAQQYARPVQPQQPVQPQYGQYTPYPQQPQNRAYAPYPPKRKTGTGVKVFIGIMVGLFAATLISFIAYVAVNPSNGNQIFATQPDRGDFGFTIPFEEYDDGDEDETEPITQAPSGNYKESDAHDKTSPDYKGLKLHKRPSKKPKKDYGSAYAFESVEKSVVAVIGYVEGQDGSENSYSVMGSGIIITSDGYIVTNSHLLDNSRTAYKYKVFTYDKKSYDAGVVGYDGRTDLAVLKIDAKGLSTASFGNSDDIEITEDVIVVGNPRSLKFQNSVTKGIVSAVNRRVSTSNNVRCIQTDAAINPGNSGGPLTNMYGQIIGISSSKIATEDTEGMCFAIPSKTVKSVVDDIIRHSYVQGRVRIGILGTVVYIDDDYNTGIQIEEITADGPVDDTDAKVGDIIIAADGETVQNFADMYDILEKHKAGDEVTLTLDRNGSEIKVKVKLEEDKN